MSNKDKIYFCKSCTYEDLVEWAETTDLTFTYKGVGYNITTNEATPCITVITGTTQDWIDNLHEYSSFKELIDNHVFDDGVPLLEAFKTDEVDDY